MIYIFKSYNFLKSNRFFKQVNIFLNKSYIKSMNFWVRNNLCRFACMILNRVHKILIMVTVWPSVAYYYISVDTCLKQKTRIILSSKFCKEVIF